jgi:hypothetical protein
MGRSSGNAHAGKAYGVHGEGPHSWTKGYQQELKHEGLIASGGFSEVHKEGTSPWHDGTEANRCVT